MSNESGTWSLFSDFEAIFSLESLHKRSSLWSYEVMFLASGLCKSVADRLSLSLKDELFGWQAFGVENLLILSGATLFDDRSSLCVSSGGRGHNDGDIVVSELEFDDEDNGGSDTCRTVVLSTSILPEDVGIG